MKRLNLSIALLIMTGFQLLGCVSGYYSYKTIDQNIAQPTNALSDIRIAYVAADLQHDITSSIERALRERFHVVDLKIIKDANQKELERILIRAKVQYDSSLASKIWGLVSLISLSVIPAIIDEDTTITFDVVAPNGENKTFQYHFAGRFYNWLPFMFLAPDFSYVIMNGQDDNRKKLLVLDKITAQFLIEATPFIVSHYRLLRDSHVIQEEP